MPRDVTRMIRASSVPAAFAIFDREAEPVSIQAATGDDEGGGPPTFNMTAYTGGAMNVGFGLPVVVDLATLKVTAKSRPILRDHDTTRVVGHTDNIRNTGRAITASGVISAVGAEADDVVQAGANGFPWQASIGAIPGRVVEVEAGQKISVNGRTFSGPLFVAKAARLMEISFVALGADDNTSARVAASAGGTILECYGMNFEQWLKAKGFDADTITDAQRTSLQAAFDAEQASDGSEGGDGDGVVQAAREGTGDSPTDPPPENQVNATTEIAAIRAEHARVADVHTATPDHPEIRAQAVAEGWDSQRAELEVLRASRPQAGSLSAPMLNTGGANAAGAPESGSVLAAAVGLTAGLSAESMASEHGQDAVNAASSGDMRGLGLRGLMTATIQAAGAHVPAGGGNEFIRAAFEADRIINAAGGGAGFSTIGGLSGILNNVANKTLLAAYEAVATVGETFARVEPNVPDFKKMTRFRLTGKGAFTKLGPDGELKHVSLSEEGYENQIDTEGGLIALTRQMIINDDLGAFLQIPRIMGRMSAINKEKAIFSALLGAGVFFSADNENLVTGAGSALSIEGVEKAMELFRNRKDSNGDPVLASPKYLLVPTGLSTLATQLARETRVEVAKTGAKSTEAQFASNPHVGLFDPITSPYLNGQQLAGSSATAWYLLADPRDVPVVEIAYLRGQTTPVIESASTDFTTLGMQFRGYHDFGVALQDDRGGVKSNGV